MKKIILLELNEVPFKVIDYFSASQPYSVLSGLLNRATQYLTLCRDEVELDPWISWPTLHRGVNDRQHGIYHLGQILTDADRRFPPIWRLLAENGRRVGVFGSVHSNQVPRSLEGYEFYLPDFFDDKVFAHPEYLRPFQRFNLGMTRRSTRNVDRKVPLELVLEFAKSAPRLGLSWDTISSILRQLVDERRAPRLRLRRRSLQAQVMGDVFFSLIKSRQPDFATFYTNHVAAAMHRYWAAAFPDDDKENAMGDQWRKDYQPEILEAMTRFDKILGRLKRWIDVKADTILLIATSMGQQAVKYRPARGGFTIRNMDKFMAALGLAPSQYSVRPAMSPCSGVVVAPDAAGQLKAKLEQFAINGKRFVQSDREVYPLSFGVYEQNFFSFFAYFENYTGEEVASIGNEGFPFEDVGFGFFTHEDGIAVSAHHHQEGVLLIYDPHAGAVDRRRLPVSTTEIAPAILDHFGLPLPSYMSHSTGRVRAALRGVFGVARPAAA